VALGLVVSAMVPRGELSGEEYRLWTGWERETLPSVIFDIVGIGRHDSRVNREADVREYFRLTSEIRAALDADPVDRARVRSLEDERARYENAVESHVEAAISAVLRSERVVRALPLFDRAPVLWPPVNFELTDPPLLLIRSPRDQIKRDGDTLLKTGLTLDDRERIERQIDDNDTISIVEDISGLAAYPAMVTANRTYDAVLDTAAHEWIHHYLAFFPLGRAWGRGGTAHALNETVANIAGREIARLVRERHPLKLDAGADGRRPPHSCQPEREIDFFQEMRKLRVDVDALLAEGRVDDAESTMEDRRQEFARSCIFIRKLNQAYFAFHGTYADSAASSDPIGPKVQRVFDLAGGLAPFLRVIRETDTAERLDALLTVLEAAATRSR
jgi:hypothetical protein